MIDSVLAEIGRSLRESFLMFFETWWPLVFGFCCSGVLQRFASRDQLLRRLGAHGPLELSRASLFGGLSSSCSYAASAMAKSLFQKGADFVSSTVFLVASTNLVLELGIVLVVLMGWQFMAAEFAGAAVMIALVGILGGAVFSTRLVDSARRHLGAAPVADGDVAPSGSPHGSDAQRGPELRSLAAWSDAASYTVADLKMLRRELAIGYLLAGFLAVVVPNGLWNAVFLRGDGTWTLLENAVVGPVIAFASCVCSIGNVPMAASLWKGGISFGGVASFLFGDLIAAPLVLVYLRYYGASMTVRLVALLWGVMAAAGLIVELAFGALGIAPAHHLGAIRTSAIGWNATSVLDVAFLAVFAAVVWLARNRARFGGGAGFAFDPVCGMQVRIDEAPASVLVGGQRVVFCSDRCASRFVARQGDTDSPAAEHPAPGPAVHRRVVDPVCGMTIEREDAAAARESSGRTFFFCSTWCAATFDADPMTYARPGERESN